MNASVQERICPKGHPSADADYCSECGTRMGEAGGESSATDQTVSEQGQHCPDCGTVREREDVSFCEVCGYNFVTGAHGEISPVPREAEPTPTPAEDVDVQPAEEENVTVPRWCVVVTTDPSLRGPQSPEAPMDVPPVRIELTQPSTLIGRRDETRGIAPEVALPLDEAVSRRHALLQLDDRGKLILRDIGAANGTRLNGREVQSMVDEELHAGDQITLGHWSRLSVENC